MIRLSVLICIGMDLSGLKYNVKVNIQDCSTMKLLYIAQYFTFPEQPSGTRAYDLATSFAKKGIDVTVISTETHPEKHTPKWKRIERDGIKVFKVKCPYDNKMSFKSRVWSFIKFAWYASLKGLSQDFDLILATSTPLTTGIPAKFLHYIKKKPYVFEVRDVWPSVPIGMGFFKNKRIQCVLYSLEKSIYQSAAHIVPLSIGMLEDIEQRYPNNKMTVIPNICNLDRFSRCDDKLSCTLPPNKRILLYAGSFGKVNGIKYVVELALLTLPLDEDLVYVLIGKGGEKEQIRQLARDTGLLGRNLFILDPIPKGDLPSLYSRVTVGSSFVSNIPVLWENSANKFFDTLAAGRPIVINHEGWQADVIRKKNIGYVLPQLLTQTVAEDFVAYMKNLKLIEEQERNTKDVAKEYSLDSAVFKYLTIFSKIDNKNV